MTIRASSNPVRLRQVTVALSTAVILWLCASRASGADASQPVQRAAILMPAPSGPSDVTTYEGKTIWAERWEGVQRTHGATLTARIEIPRAGLRVFVLFTNVSNADTSIIQAEIVFNQIDARNLGDVSKIRVPQMRVDNADQGDYLSGSILNSSKNRFVSSIDTGAGDQRNVELLACRNWIDVPIMFSDRTVGKLTFEKGLIGRHLMIDAIKNWGLDLNKCQGPSA